MTLTRLIYLTITFVQFLHKHQPLCVIIYDMTLDVSKACGPDHIPAFLLKCCAEVISSPLSYLFNESMSPGRLPRDRVCANVVPVFKRDDRHTPSNYRPISLTPIVIKTMEHIIHSKLTTVLESYILISVHQFDFRKHHSTIHLLLEAVHDWASSPTARFKWYTLLLDLRLSRTTKLDEIQYNNQS